MTRLPADAQLIEPLRGPEWPAYKVAPLCAHSHCSKFTDDAHHIVRRSWTIGPYDWVKIDGHPVGNLLPLCWVHHRMVTDNKARIVWDNYSHKFFWQQGEEEMALRQPPTVEQVQAGEQMQVEQAEACPTCHQKLPRENGNGHRHEEKRQRKTWTVTVPADAREVGADVLDTLLESARLILADRGLTYGEGKGVKYFVLSTALGLFVAHAEEVLD